MVNRDRDADGQAMAVTGMSVGSHAAEDPKTQVGRLVRLYRDALGMDQARLADLANLGNKQTVSAIERGERDVKAFELSRIARALHVTMDVLLGIVTPPRVAQVLWRRRDSGSLDALTQERFLRRNAQLRQRAQRYAMLEEWCGVEPADELPDYPIDVRTVTYSGVAKLADKVRGQLDLGGIPAASLEDTLATQFGVKIFYDALGQDGEASAACVRDDETSGCAVLLNSDEAAVRRAFSLAHELFHLVTWNSVAEAWESDVPEQAPEAGATPPWYEHLEKCAQSFAAALLIPADRVVAEMERRAQRCAGGAIARAADHLGPSDYAYIAHVAFRVSTDALLWRLYNLNQLTRDEREHLATHPELSMWAAHVRMRENSQRGTFPEQFWELIRLASDRGEAGLSKLAEFAELPDHELYRLLSATPRDPDYEASARESAEAAAV